MKTKMTVEEKAQRAIDRKEARAEQKRVEKVEAEKNQPRIGSIKFSIEWSRSKTWGSNPHITATAYGNDGNYIGEYNGTCSGCGYDKESTVIAQAFNYFLKYKLHLLAKKIVKERGTGKVPYGIHYDAESENCYFDGGIGTECYRAISEFIGGEFSHTISGKSFGVFVYTDKGTIK